MKDFSYFCKILNKINSVKRENMDYSEDERIVMTLDAGGTNFVFTAIQGNQQIVEPIRLPSNADNLSRCLKTMVEGFTLVKENIKKEPIAISFAFPGPADYENGVIGKLPNLIAFNEDFPLKAFLESKFDIPVFINNDGNLFAYGEALAGMLPYINKKLKENGNSRLYRNLIGITLGTGLGAGVVINGELLMGDNGCGGDVWLFRDRFNPEVISEESTTIHAVKRMYAELSCIKDEQISPKDIYDIAEGKKSGDIKAAKETFEKMGQGLGNVLCHALTLIDGIVIIGGGLSASFKCFFPGMLAEMRREIQRIDNSNVSHLQMEVYDMTNPSELDAFLKSETKMIMVPETDRIVTYVSKKKTGIAVCTQDTSVSISLGAYNFALNKLDKG